MSLIVAGCYRVPPENLSALRPHMLTVIAGRRGSPAEIGRAHV